MMECLTVLFEIKWDTPKIILKASKSFDELLSDYDAL